MGAFGFARASRNISVWRLILHLFLPVVPLLFGLISAPAAAAQWVSVSNGNIPAGAAIGGAESYGLTIYICQARHSDGSLQPGKTWQGYNYCLYPFGGSELVSYSYSVLTDVVLSWTPFSGSIPTGAIVTGQDSTFGSTYECRGSHE